MDLGRPVARHLIQRPHEALDLEADIPDEPAEQPAELGVDEPLTPERPDR